MKPSLRPVRPSARFSYGDAAVKIAAFGCQLRVVCLYHADSSAAFLIALKADRLELQWGVDLRIDLLAGGPSSTRVDRPFEGEKNYVVGSSACPHFWERRRCVLWADTRRCAGFVRPHSRSFLPSRPRPALRPFATFRDAGVGRPAPARQGGGMPIAITAAVARPWIIDLHDTIGNHCGMLSHQSLFKQLRLPLAQADRSLPP